jgi:hypothetical protein
MQPKRSHGKPQANELSRDKRRDNEEHIDAFPRHRMLPLAEQNWLAMPKPDQNSCPHQQAAGKNQSQKQLGDDRREKHGAIGNSDE